MSFTQFAEAHGLVIRDVISDGRWHRVPTRTKPHKKNGAYLFDGVRGVVRDWASEGFATWRDDGANRSNVGRSVARDITRSLENERKRQAKARQEAQTLLSECDRAKHPYLARKGFPDVLGLVHPSGDLLIPMRDRSDYNVVNSVQRIDAEGNKKFLTGGKAKGSIFRIGSKGVSWLVEGYATGLSVQMALNDLHQIPCVIVCFSAGNLVHVAKFVKRPAFVFADNDESGAGRKAAVDTGLPYCMWGELGDANDLMLARNVRAVCSLILDAQNSD